MNIFTVTTLKFLQSRIVLGLIAVAYLLIYSKSFDRNWQDLIGVYPDALLVNGNVNIEKKKFSLPGFKVSRIDVDPDRPSFVVISGDKRHFASQDHGETWRVIRSNRYSLGKDCVWLDGKLVSTGSTRKNAETQLIYSEDFGETWQVIRSPVGNGWFSSVVRDQQGEIWVTYPAGDRDIAHKVFSTEAGVVVSHIGKKEFTYHYTTNREITVDDDSKLSASVIETRDGYWAATERGPYYRTKTAASWNSRSANLYQGFIENVIRSPIYPNEWLTWGVGRLWQSHDHGEHWQAISGGYVSSAAYLDDGSFLVLYENHRLVLHTQGSTKDISPHDGYFFNATNTDAKNPRSSKLFKVFQFGGSVSQVWLVAGTAILFLPPDELKQGYYKYISKIIKNSPEEQDNVGLFLYRPGVGWQQQDISKLQQLDKSMSGPCALELRNNTLFVDAYKVPNVLANKTIQRAGWVNNGKNLFLMTDDRVQYTRIENCRPIGVFKVWQLKRLAIKTNSIVDEVASGLRVWTPESYGVTTFKLHVRSPSLWRWFMYQLCFGVGAYIAWSALLIWAFCLFGCPQIFIAREVRRVA